MGSGFFWKVTRAPLSKVAAYRPLDLFPIRHTLRDYDRLKLGGDLRAAANVSLLAFPQGIAYALIAGLPVYYGIFGSAIAAILGAFFSRNHFIVLGPTNATAVLLMSALSGAALVQEKLILMPIIVLLSGAFLIIGAYLRLSAFIQYISRTVVTGYITAGALLIIANQIKNALGFSFAEQVSADTFFETLYYTVVHLPQTHAVSLGLSILTLGVYLLASRKCPALPNVAITLIILSFAAALMRYFNLEGLVLLDPVLITEWKFTPPTFNMNMIREVFGVSMAIALLSVLEGTSIGKSLAARYGSRLDTNQEMFGMGVANIGCGLFSGMPASGSLTRSVLNCNSGAKSPLSSLYAGLLMVVGALLFGSLVRYIPLATLSVLIICIGVSLIQPRNIRLVLKATPSDRAVFLASVITGLFLGLDLAIYVGTGLAIMLFLRQASHPDLVEYEFNQEGQLAERGRESQRAMPEVSIVHVEGDLFFGAADIFRDQIRRICDDPNLKVVVLRLKNARLLDASSVMALYELVDYMQEKNRYTLVSGIRKEIYRVFRDSGLLERIGRENIFRESIQNPTLSTANAIRRAQKLLGGDAANVTLYVDPSKRKGSDGEDASS